MSAAAVSVAEPVGGPAPVVRRPARQDPAERRRALYHLASPVSVLTVNRDGHLHGTTASTVTLISKDPLLLGVCLRVGSSFAQLAKEEGRFAVNVLGAQQAELAQRFAGRRPDGLGQFAGVQWSPAPTRAPRCSTARWPTTSAGCTAPSRWATAWCCSARWCTPPPWRTRRC